MTGMISYQQMVEIIQGGGSVMIPDYRDGLPIARVEDLPDAAEMARLDPSSKKQGLEDLRRRQAELESAIQRVLQASGEKPVAVK